MPGADDKKDDASSWNNSGTYIGVAGVVIAGGLYYTRTIRTMFALILAVLALAAGWYMQPGKEDEKETGKDNG